MCRGRLSVFVIMFAATGFAAELHVSPSGNDANDGTAAAPFATPIRARDAIRVKKQNGEMPVEGMTVWLHGGDYPLIQGFVLTDADSGTAEKAIIYRAVVREEVRLIGGRKLSAESFKPVTDQSVLDRIDADSRPHVVCADLKSLGIADHGELPDAFESAPPVPELFFNDQRMTLARWPNDGWAEIANVIESGPAPWRNHQSGQPGTFEYSGDRPSRWTRAPAVWVHGYWCFDWSCETIKVGSIDTEKRRIAFVKPHHYGIGSGNPAARRYYALNLLEELDQPGEYYIDRENGSLYFWPPEPIGQARMVLSTLREPAVSLDGASHVMIEGFTVETCVGEGIRIKSGCKNRVAGCRVRNTGLDGIVVGGGEKHVVAACDIYDTGTAGLQIGGGDHKTLTPSGHEAVNNHIYRVSRRQRTHAYNVHIGGVGVRLAHNLLNDAPHQAIGLTGNDHMIEFNEIHHISMESDDCGAFYMGRDPSERGTVLRYNFWHDIGGPFTHGSCAIYFDDGSGGQTVFGNVFYRAAGGQFGAVFVHGGHDNTVDNNIFVECKKAIGHVPWNNALWEQWLREPLWQGKLLKEVDITRSPFIDHYPDLKGFMDSANQPRVNHAARNVAVRCEAFIDGNWNERDHLITDDDPGFVDAAHGNFQLRDDSMVFKKAPGFVKIPFEKIGLFQDELRPQLPPATR